MHMLIRVVSEAYDAEDATGIAHGLFEGVDAPLYRLRHTHDRWWSLERVTP